MKKSPHDFTLWELSELAYALHFAALNSQVKVYKRKARSLERKVRRIFHKRSMA